MSEAHDASVHVYVARNTHRRGLGRRPFGTYPQVGFKQGAWRDVGYWRFGLSRGPPADGPTPFVAIKAPA